MKYLYFTAAAALFGVLSFYVLVTIYSKGKEITPTAEEITYHPVVCVYNNGDRDTISVDLLPSSYLRLNGNGCLEVVDTYIPNNPSEAKFVRCGLRYFYFK